MKRLFILSVLVFILAACGYLTDDDSHWYMKTADKGLTVGFRLQQPPVAPTPDNPVVPPTPTEESLLPTVTPTPECVNAKANISSTNEKIYHLPGDANYNAVKIDKDGEAIYCTAAEAEAAGFRRALR